MESYFVEVLLLPGGVPLAGPVHLGAAYGDGFVDADLDAFGNGGGHELAGAIEEHHLAHHRYLAANRKLRQLGIEFASLTLHFVWRPEVVDVPESLDVLQGCFASLG